jgi:hypothetical protein
VTSFADLVRELSKIMSELRALRDDEKQRKTMEATPPADECTPVPRAEILPPPAPDEEEPGAADFDTRLTVEIPPSSTGLGGDDGSEEEQTVVVERPPAGHP